MISPDESLLRPYARLDSRWKNVMTFPATIWAVSSAGTPAKFVSMTLCEWLCGFRVEVSY